MAKEDYTQLAADVVKAVGGKENIVSVTNCMTRLRFVLKDDTIPNEEKVKAIKGVKGVMNQGGQYQVIIGTQVSQVVEYVKKEAGVSGEEAPAAEAPKAKGFKGVMNAFFKTISGSIFPLLGVMIAGGIIKGVLTILVTAGVLSAESGTYLILYAASDAAMYFLPILVGYNCGKLFGCNPYTTAVIGAAFLYPNLVSAVTAEGAALTFLRIPVQASSYANTFLPVLLAGFVANKLEKLAKKFIPAMLQTLLVPAFVLVITVPFGWLVVGPLMNAVSGVLSVALTSAFALSPLVGGILIGAFWQLMVVLGLHYAFVPILIATFFTNGSDPMMGVMGITVWALAGVALGYALKVKDPEEKSAGFGSFASAMCGITEPAIYSVALPDIKRFACAWIAGGITGGIFGQLGGRLYAVAGDGLFRIPGMINPAGLDISFYSFIILAPLALAIAAVLTYVVTKAEPVAVPAAAGDTPSERQSFDQKPLTVYAPVKGTVIAQQDIPDETFATGVLGDGIGIDPEEGLVVAPFDGEISSVVDTKHAVGITSPDGMELLIHVGVDTVKMNGEGFRLFVKEGDAVKAGQKLIAFDIDAIRKAGLSPITAVLVTNAEDYGKLNFNLGKCEQLNEVITVSR